MTHLSIPQINQLNYIHAFTCIYIYTYTLKALALQEDRLKMADQLTSSDFALFLRLDRTHGGRAYDDSSHINISYTNNHMKNMNNMGSGGSGLGCGSARYETYKALVVRRRICI